MSNRLKIVKIDSKYCDYLRKYDDKVCYNAGYKELSRLLVYYLL